MTRAEIATRIHQQTGISIEEAAEVLDQILEFIKTTLQSGESIKIDSFGKFTVRNKRARTGRNPKTGEAITISARRVVTFQPSLLFKKEINSPSADEREGGA
ncbi:MAG: integration host factor subunit alpha [Nitrospira sp.]